MVIYPDINDHQTAVPTIYDNIDIGEFEVTMNSDRPSGKVAISIRPNNVREKHKKRGEDITTLIMRTRSEAEAIMSVLLNNTIGNSNNSDLQLNVKSFLENYKSILDYAAHYLADKCNPVPNERHIFFPIANLNTTREEFIKIMQRSYPNLDKNCKPLFDFLLTVQHFNNDTCLIELNQLVNTCKHRGLTDFRPANFKSVLIKCGEVGFRIGEFGYNSISIGEKGKLLLGDNEQIAVISGPCKISIDDYEYLKKIPNLTIIDERRTLLKELDSEKSLPGILWYFSVNVIRILNGVCGWYN